MAQRILFVCEHGSAKSTIAAAHCARIARERELDVRASSRGTDPDSTYPPHVLAGLHADGLAPLEDSPSALTEDDIASATIIVTFCSPALLPTQTSVTEVWDDIPPVSESYEKARTEIVNRVEEIMGA